MTETPFNKYSADTTVDTVKSGGDQLIASAESNQNEWLNSLKERNAALLKYELEGAKVVDDRFNKLAQLSSTAAQVAAPIIQARTNEQLLKGAQEYKNGLATDKAQRQSEYERDKKQNLTEELINNEIIDDAEKKGDIDPWLKHKLKTLPRLQKIGFQEAMYNQEAKLYPIFREQNKSIPIRIEDSNGQLVDRALEDAKDPNEWYQINERLVRAYIRPFATHDMPMVEEHLFTEMRNIEETEFGEWQTAKLDQIETEANEKVDMGLRDNFSKDPNSLMNYALTQANRFGSIQQAHDNGIELLKKDIALGLLNSDDIKALRNSVYSDKTTKTDYLYGDRFGRKLLILEEAIHERDKKEYDKKTSTETIQFNKFEETALGKYKEKFANDELPTAQEIEDDQEESVKLFGKRSTKLDSIKQDLTVEAKEIDRQVTEVKKLADLGLLTNDRLSSYNWKVVQQFQGVAQVQTVANTEAKAWLGDIEALVKSRGKVFPDGSMSANSRQMARKLKGMYRQTLIKALENPKEGVDPYSYSFAVVKDYLEKQDSTTRGWNLDLPLPNQVTSASLSIVQGRKETDQFITLGVKSLDEQDTFFSASEISDALKGYGKSGWQPNEKSIYIADKYNIDPLAVLQRQARAYDPSVDLRIPESIKAFNEKVDVYNRKLILFNPTFDGVSRAWGTTGEVNYFLFKNKEETKDLSESVGLQDYEIEAANELGFIGKTEPLDEDETTNYFKTVYKLSGGTDTRALQQLIRPSFKP